MTNRIIFIFGVVFVFMGCAYNGRADLTNSNNKAMLKDGTNSTLSIKQLIAEKGNHYYGSDVVVLRCLRWLKKIQNADGSWGGRGDPETVATGLALVAFSEHGDTIGSHEFGKNIKSGLNYLVHSCGKTPEEYRKEDVAIQYGIRAFAFCWVCQADTNLVKKESFVYPACTNALTFIIKSQRSSGLWDLQYRLHGGVDDVEASVWQIMALHMAKSCGIRVDGMDQALDHGLKALMKTIPGDVKKHTTGPAVFSLQLEGYYEWDICKTGIAALDDVTINWNNPEFENPIYQWFFITHAKIFAR